MWNDPWWMLTCPDRCPMLASLPEAVPDEAAGCPLLMTRKVWETCSCSLRPSPLRPCSFPTLGPQSSLARIPFPWPIGHAAPGWATLLVFKRFSDSSSSVPGERKGGMWETPWWMDSCCHRGPTPHALCSLSWGGAFTPPRTLLMPGTHLRPHHSGQTAGGHSGAHVFVLRIST